MLMAQDYPLAVVELTSFIRDAGNCFSSHELEELINYLAINPEAGDVIRGTGGIRKIRWGYGNRGTRGGVRVIYYFRDLNMPVFLLAIYKKGERSNLTNAERNEMRKFVNELVATYGKQWLRIVRDQLA